MNTYECQNMQILNDYLAGKSSKAEAVDAFFRVLELMPRDKQDFVFIKMAELEADRASKTP